MVFGLPLRLTLVNTYRSTKEKVCQSKKKFGPKKSLHAPFNAQKPPLTLFIVNTYRLPFRNFYTRYT